MRDGATLEDAGDDGSEGIGADDEDGAPAGTAEPGLGEDAQVEAKDGELGEVYGALVKDLIEVEQL